MKKKTIVIILIIFFLLSVSFPSIIDWVIVNNNFPSNIKNSDWVGFLGGYLGSIIGSITSLVGIVVTIRYTNEQNRISREVQVQPYCSIRYVHEDKIHGTNKILGIFTLVYKSIKNNGPNYRSTIYIKNVGMGPALDFEIYDEDIDDGRTHCPVLPQLSVDADKNACFMLQPGEEGAIPMNIVFNFDPITKEDINIDEKIGPYVKQNIAEKYKNFEIRIKIRYYDVFQNKFEQSITLKAEMSRLYRNLEAEHKCDIYLNDITAPKKLNKRK